MRALILSAGLGERLRPLTTRRAKPAIEFLNVPMLGFPYYWLNTLGLTDVVFNTHHLPDTIRRAALHVARPETRIHFSSEPDILGSGGGIWNARFDLMADPTFAVANGDGVVLSSDPHLMRKMLAFHEAERALATILVCPLEGVGTRLPGVWIKSDGSVIGFGKSSPSGSGICLHYASYMLFSERLWPMLPPGNSNILYDVLTAQIEAGERVLAFRADDLIWFETGNVPDYLTATRSCLEMIRDGTPHGRCALDILQTHAQSFGLQSQLERLSLIADSADINATAHLEGFNVVGENAKVEAGAALRDCVVLSGAVARGSVESQVII